MGNATVERTKNKPIFFNAKGAINHAQQTTAFDNGSEFAGHKALQGILNTPVYFAHPYR